MNNTISEIKRNSAQTTTYVILGLALLIGAILLIIFKAPVWADIVAGLCALGCFAQAAASEKASCPNCGYKISKVSELGAYVKCPGCESYLHILKNEKRIEIVDEEGIASAPIFSMLLPWNGFDLPGVTEAYGVIGGFMLKTTERQNLNAKWPDGCCICGSTVNHEESVSKVFRVTPGSKLGIRSPVSKDVTVFVTGIPHCQHHTGGVALQIGKSIYGEDNGFLAFRSLSYYRRFVQLNSSEKK